MNKATVKVTIHVVRTNENNNMKMKEKEKNKNKKNYLNNFVHLKIIEHLDIVIKRKDNLFMFTES